MRIATEGWREIMVASLVLGAIGVSLGMLWWPLAVPFGLVWIGVVWFFRDPVRERTFVAGEVCAPADGRVTDVARLAHHDVIGGPAIRISVFLSLFDVHANRAPCAARVRAVQYRRGEFLDARHPESGRRNESNTLLLEPLAGLPGPMELKQVSGAVARRIVCHAREGYDLAMGERFGMIKFGSRTELVIPMKGEPRILIQVGDKIRAGATVLARY